MAAERRFQGLTLKHETRRPTHWLNVVDVEIRRIPHGSKQPDMGVCSQRLVLIGPAQLSVYINSNYGQVVYRMLF